MQMNHSCSRIQTVARGVGQRFGGQRDLWVIRMRLIGAIGRHSQNYGVKRCHYQSMVMEMRSAASKRACSAITDSES